MTETPPNRLEEPAAGRHLSADLFRRFLEQRASHSERKAVVRHLITLCPACVALAQRLTAELGYWFGVEGAEAFAEGDYDTAFQAAFRFADRTARRMALERLRGWAHWSTLAPLPASERLPLIAARRDWHHWGLFRALLEAAGVTGLRDPRAAAGIAQLALDSADLLDPLAVGGEPAASDLRARAWAVLADCRRLASDLEGARRAIAQAWRCHEEGTRDPLDRGRLLAADAAYAAAVGEIETAVVILEEALSLHVLLADPHLQGSTLVQMATTIGSLDPDRGIAHVEHGLQLLNPVRAPRLELCAQHALAELLAEAGRPQEALAVLDRVRPLYRQFPDEGAQLRLHWLQGRIALALEQFADAVDILRHVQQGFRAGGRQRDILLATLDLAEAHLALGQTAAALRMLAEATPEPAEPTPHPNAVAAWLFLQHELAARLATDAKPGGLFSHLRRYYRRAWHVPSAAFSPSG